MRAVKPQGGLLGPEPLRGTIDDSNEVAELNRHAALTPGGTDESHEVAELVRQRLRKRYAQI